MDLDWRMHVQCNPVFAPERIKSDCRWSDQRLSKCLAGKPPNKRPILRGVWWNRLGMPLLRDFR